MTYVFSPQKSTKSVCVLALILLIMSEGAQARTMIFGLDKARNFHQSSRGPFYIQLAAFSTKKHAADYLRHTKLPATIQHNHDVYSVVVGPIASVNEVRAMAGNQSAPAAPVRTTSSKMGELTPEADNFFTSHGYVQADLGASGTMSSGNMEIYNGAVDPYPANVDVFSTRNHWHGGMASVMAGLRFSEARTYIPAYAFALRYQHMFSQQISGTITQYSDPDFQNYHYNWNVNANVFSILSKVNLVEFNSLSPYVNLGLGYALTKAGQYHESAIGGVVARSDSPDFASRRNHQFSYSLGAGLDYQVNPQTIMSVGYEFQQLGAIRSGYGQPNWTAEALALNHYKTSTALLSMSYLFGA